MSYLNGQGLNALWSQIDDVFARLSEAGHNIALADTTITLYAVDGTALASINLNSKFPTTSQAAGSLSLSGNTLSLLAVDGSSRNSVDLSNTGGGITLAQANALYGKSLSISGKTLYLRNANGAELNHVTLP